jgi:hypothetical protein
MRVRQHPTRKLAGLTAVGFALAATPLLFGTAAQAAVVATVPLGTANGYSVLAGETITNVGFSNLRLNLGLSPGTSVTGFPPGFVLSPSVIHQTDTEADQAKLDLASGYSNAAGRPVTAIVNADLVGLTLAGGVYSAEGGGPLTLSGTLTLDAAGNTDTVFIFQTDSTLITASGSTVNLINGAQACRVFWQVGSSATLGSGSSFSGTIMALASITVQSSVTVHGRALARNGSVTLISDSFTAPTCAAVGTGTATTTGATNATATTADIGTNPTNPTTAVTTGDSGVEAELADSSTVPVTFVFPRTGSSSEPVVLLAIIILFAGITATWFTVRRPTTK